MIYRLLSDNPERTVIYVRAEDKTVHIVFSGKIFSSQLDTFDFHFLNQIASHLNAVVVSDSFVPPSMQIPTLVLSSPGILTNKTFKSELKSFWPRAYMPMPTEDEVLRMRELVFPALPEADVMNLMALWGPIPRRTLVEISTLEQFKLLKQAESVGLDELARLSRGISTCDENDHSHMLVHQRAMGQDAALGSVFSDPRNPLFYLRGMCVIASDPFLLKISEKLQASQNWQAAFFINSDKGICALGLRGIMSQDTALRILAGGGDFKIRYLGKNVAGSGEFSNRHK